MKAIIRLAVNRLRAVKGDPMTLRDVTIRPSGGAASDAKGHINRRGAESIRHRTTTRPRGRCAEMISRATIRRIERCGEPIRRREAMTPRDATIRLHGGAASDAKSLRIRPSIERCGEPTRRLHETVRRRGRRAEMI